MRDPGALAASAVGASVLAGGGMLLPSLVGIRLCGRVSARLPHHHLPWYEISVAQSAVRIDSPSLGSLGHSLRHYPLHCKSAVLLSRHSAGCRARYHGTAVYAVRSDRPPRLLSDQSHVNPVVRSPRYFLWIAACEGLLAPHGSSQRAVFAVATTRWRSMHGAPPLWGLPGRFRRSWTMPRGRRGGSAHPLRPTSR